MPDETVTTSRERLYVARGFGCVAQSLPQTLNRVVDAVVEIYEGVGRPYSLLEFLSANYFARLL
jgi:hypothetical protein